MFDLDIVINVQANTASHHDPLIACHNFVNERPSCLLDGPTLYASLFPNKICESGRRVDKIISRNFIPTF